MLLSSQKRDMKLKMAPADTRFSVTYVLLPLSILFLKGYPLKCNIQGGK